MKRSHSTALGLTVAIALSTGGVAVEHPLHTDPAPRTYGDIVIAEADNQKIPPDTADKTATSPPSQTVTPANPSAEDPPAVETTFGEESKGTPPRKP
jgi:hypothetical protein